MTVRERASDVARGTKKYFLFFICWTILGVLMGGVGGGIGSVFAHALEWAAELRGKYPFMLLFLPVAGIAVTAIYKGCRLKKAGTNGVFETVRDERTVPVLLAPAVFAGTFLTHLCGGSAGREGAALQIGGSIASLLGKLVPINDRHRHILTLCGMSALFSALFGTPVGACIFAVEVVSVGKLYTAAFYPCIASSVTAFIVAQKLHVAPERFNIGEVSWAAASSLWKAALIGIAAALAGILFCTLMHGTHHLMKKYLTNAYIRAAVGGLLIIALTLVFGSEYDGSGHDTINGIFDGAAIRPEAFLLKMLFTAVTMGAGFKGGEIVPTLFIGATLGGTIASIVGLSVPFGAALGMMALFSAVTNCPIAAIVLFVELFGAQGIVLCTLAVMISYLLAGKFGLYDGQKIVYSKLDDARVK